jgi:hypothetical protein
VIRRATALCAIAIVVTACTTVVSDTPPPTATSGKYTDAAQAEILTESIELVYGTDPQPDWYPAFIDLRVEDRWAYVRTTLSETDVALADGMCANIAAATFDDDAEPIGVTDVLIFGTGNIDLADCDVPLR